MKGRVTPVTGTKPMTTERFRRAWRSIDEERPKAMYLLVKLFADRDTFKER